MTDTERLPGATRAGAARLLETTMTALDTAISHAREGRDVLWLDDDMRQSQFSHEQAVTVTPDAKHCRVNGALRIEFPSGGRVYFRSRGQSIRGHALDAVAAPASFVAWKGWADIHAALMTSRLPETERLIERAS